MTKENIQLLKEFLPINTSFILRNDIIGIVSPDKSACMFYNPKDFTDFKTPAHVYSVDQLLLLVDTLGIDSSIDIKGKSIELKNGKKVIKYVLANDVTVPAAPTEIETKFEEWDKDIAFDLNKNDLEQIRKISSLLGLNELVISQKEGKVTITVGEQGNMSSSNYSILTNGEGTDSEVSISTELIGKLSLGDYSVESSTTGVTKFSSKTIPTLRYYITNNA